MARVEKTIEVDVPVRTAYNQWTQFEEFPSFMEGVEEVRQVDDRHLRWRASIGGMTKEWDAEIREQSPDEKIIWRSTTGAENAGMVMFDVLSPGRTRVHLEMSYDPEGFTENVGSALGFVSRRVEGDLERFKELIERRGAASGGWRGEIENEAAPGGHTRGMPRGAGESRMRPGDGNGGEAQGHDTLDRGTAFGGGAGYAATEPTAGHFGPGYDHERGSTESDVAEATRDTGHDRGGAGYLGSAHADELGQGSGRQSPTVGRPLQGKLSTTPPAALDDANDDESPGMREELAGKTPSHGPGDQPL